MIIAGRTIDHTQPPYVIAEVSCNHNGDINRALDIAVAAHNAGADAVKFQAYTPDTITIDCDQPDFIMKDGPWKGRKLYDLYKEAQTPLEWFPRIAEFGKSTGTTWFASVFDKTSVDLLEKLDCPAYKIASCEIVDIPLIRYVATKAKPMIVSTGMAADEEIKDAFDTIMAQGRSDLAILHCVSAYPCPDEQANLARFNYLKRMSTRCQWGISDHTDGIEFPMHAATLGATIVEKHIRLDDEPTLDGDFSLTPDAFSELVNVVRYGWQMIQPAEASAEEPSRQARRSLYAVANIKAGEPFTEENVRSIRPGYGLPPKMLDDILGRKATCDIFRGTALNDSMIG